MVTDGQRPEPTDDASKVAVVEEGYELASKKLMSELLPQFVETAPVQKWLKKQAEEELTEIELTATMQAPRICAAFKKWLKDQKSANARNALAGLSEANDAPVRPWPTYPTPPTACFVWPPIPAYAATIGTPY